MMRPEPYAALDRVWRRADGKIYRVRDVYQRVSEHRTVKKSKGGRIHGSRNNRSPSQTCAWRGSAVVQPFPTTELAAGFHGCVGNPWVANC